VPQPVPVSVATREHLRHVWLPWQKAAEKVFSPSNAEAIRRLATAGGKVNKSNKGQ
jgi:dATP pyrophosphohydrolase